MKSSLYSCDIYHKRTRPKQHEFNYKLFYFKIDLDELGSLNKSPLIGVESPNLYTLKTRDHLDFGGGSIKENLQRFINEQGHEETMGRVELVTQLRTFGHLFNPVSFFFVYNTDDQPSCVVAEVANTFNEQKLYYLGPECRESDSFKDDRSKDFYISPFSNLDTQLHFKVSFPNERMAIQIRQSDQEGYYFNSLMTGRHEALTSTNLIKQTIRFPFTTLQIVWGIHWQALRIFAKKIPVYGKKATQHMQRQVRTYLPRTFSNHQKVI